MEQVPRNTKPTAFERRVNKRAARHAAFMDYFAPGFYVRVTETRALLRGLVEDYEKAEEFSIHHRINSRMRKQSGEVLILVKNERRKA